MNATDHDDLAALAPWYAAGLLAPDDTARFETALASDPALRANVEAARADLDIVQADVQQAGAPSPQAWDRIAAAVTADPYRPTLSARLSAAWMTLVEYATARPALATSLAALAALVIVAESGALLSRTAAPPSAYQTAADPNARRTGPELLVAFAPETTLGRVSALLAARGATIVDGPRGGFYRIALSPDTASAEEMEKAIAALRAESGVTAVLRAPSR